MSLLARENHSENSGVVGAVLARQYHSHFPKWIFFGAKFWITCENHESTKMTALTIVAVV